MPEIHTLPVEETTTEPVTDDGDHDRFAHYVRKADATRAAVEGVPVRAICGKVWVPTRDQKSIPSVPSARRFATSCSTGPTTETDTSGADGTG